MTSFSGNPGSRWLRLAVLLTAIIIGAGTAHPADRLELEQALERDPANVDIRFQLAQVLSRGGALKEAEAAAMEVVEAAPEYWDAHILLARIAGWTHEYDKALSRVETVRKAQPNNREAMMLKLDLLTWKGDMEAAGRLVDEIIAAGNNTAEIRYRKASIAKQELRNLSAYRHAKTALAIDPLHEPSMKIVQDTRLVTLYFGGNVEYFAYRNTDPGRKWGYGFDVAGQVFPRSRLSVSFIDTFRYRFQTVNNQVGLEGVFRPSSRFDLTLRGMLGAPAVVLPRGTGFFSFRAELIRIMDVTASYRIEVLPWPVDRPGLLQRPALDFGVFAHRFLRFTAGYTLGLFHHCGEPVTVFHGARCGALFDNETISLSLSYGYGEEYDKNEGISGTSPTCDTLSPFPGAARALVGVTSHSVGVAASRALTRKFTLRGGYALTLLMPSTADIITPAHTIHLGGVVWF